MDTLSKMIFACVIVYAVTTLHNDDMTLCQIDHSFDTCFSALNR